MSPTERLCRPMAKTVSNRHQSNVNEHTRRMLADPYLPNNSHLARIIMQFLNDTIIPRRNLHGPSITMVQPNIRFQLLQCTMRHQPQQKLYPIAPRIVYRIVPLERLARRTIESPRILECLLRYPLEERV